MARKLLSVLLSVLMVATLFAPVTAVFAESETLLITAAEDNGGTQATTHARAAIPNLKQAGDIWYSATRSQCTPAGTAIATYTLGRAADVEGVRIAFFSANNRTFTFAVEASEDWDEWEEVFSGESELQASYVTGTAAQGYADGTHPAQDIAFDAPVYAKFLRVVITAATNQPAGTSNAYAAFHTFEAYGEYDLTAPAEPADYSAVDAAISAADALNEAEYTAASWADLQSVIESVDYSLTCFDQAIVDSVAEGIRDAIANLEYLIPEIFPACVTLYGTANSNASYGPEASLSDNAFWTTVKRPAGSNDDPELTYVLPIESEISSVKIRWYSGGARTYTFGISVSVDGNTWTEIYPTTTTQAVGASNTTYFEYPMNGVHAAYIKLICAGNTADQNTPGALYHFQVFGSAVENGFEPPLPSADYSALDNLENVVRDLTEDLYTAESWANLTGALADVNYNEDILHQANVDAYAVAVRDAIDALVFNDLEEIQIAQSFYSNLGGSPAWTNGAVLFTEPEYSLTEYKMFTNAEHTSFYQIASWTRIFCAPTDDAVLDPDTGMYDKYEIINIKGVLDNANVPVTADEVVPQNTNLIGDDWGGYGFVLALHWNVDTNLSGGGSQYASQEFGNRNKQAFDAMGLSVGDIVCLNGVINPFFETGDISAVDLDVTGTWVHRYGEFNGMGTPVRTPIYRISSDKNEGAPEGEPQYLARDQFDDFFSSATLTRYVAPQTANPGDVTGDGEVTLEDLTMLAKAVAGWAMDPNAYFVENADCNGDGEVTLEDLTLLAKYVAGWSITLGA